MQGCPEKHVDEAVSVVNNMGNGIASRWQILVLIPYVSLFGRNEPLFPAERRMGGELVRTFLASREKTWRDIRMKAKLDNAVEAYSPMSTCLNTGSKLNYQPGDTQKYIDAYFANK